MNKKKSDLADVYEIIKEITIATKDGFKKLGDSLPAKLISTKRAEQLLKDGFIISESVAIKMKEDAEAASKKVVESLGQIKLEKEAIEKQKEELAQEKAELADMLAEIEQKEADLAKDKADFAQEKADFETEKAKSKK